MIIDWTNFGPALALLLTPIVLFHGKKIRYRSASRDWDTHWPQILTLGLHFIDAGRAALGGWLLIESLHPNPAAHGIARYAIMLTQGAVLCSAVTFQVFFCKEPDSAFAPFAFVAGLGFGLYPPAVAGLPLLLAVTVAGGSRTPVAFFPTLSIAMLGLGFAIGGKAMLLNVIFGACAVMLPWLFSLMFSRDLLVSYRAKRPASGG